MQLPQATTSNLLVMVSRWTSAWVKMSYCISSDFCKMGCLLLHWCALPFATLSTFTWDQCTSGASALR